MNSLARYRRMPHDQQRLAREALRTLLREEAGLRISSPTQRIGNTDGARDDATAAAVASAVRRAAKVTRSKCLVQALAGQRMLRRRGLQAEVAVGARHEGPFQAHAWLRHGGQEVLGGPVGPYSELRAT